MKATLGPSHTAATPTMEPRLPKVSIRVFRGSVEQESRDVNTPAFFIGSANDCDLVLDEPHFPQAFAYLVLQADGVSIRHLGFAPNLLVNGRSVSRARLHDGDRLTAGPFELVVEIDHRCDTAPPETPPFGRLWIGAWGAATREPDAEVMRLVNQLLSDVRKASERRRGVIRLYVAPDLTTNEPYGGLAAS